MTHEAARPAIDHLEQLVHAQATALDLIGQNVPIGTVLDELSKLFEEQFSGSIVAIMLVDATDKSVRVGWAPGITPGLRRALEGIPIEKASLSCAAAAASAEVVIGDIGNDAGWTAIRNVAHDAGVEGCWSVPIVSSDGNVLGTFDSYWPTARRPRGRDLWVQQQYARLLQVTIERYRTVEHITDILAEERRRIAGDLHDDSIQAITAVGLRLQRLLASATPGQRELLNDVLQSVNDAVERMRHMLFELHPPALDEDGLESALDMYLDETFDQTDIAWSLRFDVGEDPTPAAAALAYRLSSEAITNVIKHSGATNISVTVRDDSDGILVEISDDGVGFDPLDVPRKRAGHLGITNAAYLAHRAAGRWRIDSTIGEGTLVSFWLPSGML